jgi:4-hydroxybenzoyl-CoA reductase subunit alpha
VQRGGAYAGYGIVTILYAGALLHGLYDHAGVKYDGYRVYTNTAAVRCDARPRHGGTRATPSSRCSTRWPRNSGSTRSRCAGQPAAPGAYRTINGRSVSPPTACPNAWTGSRRASGWRERYGQLPKGRGLGMACSHFVSGSATPVHWTGEPHATVILKLDFDGGITMLTGASDIGQGSSHDHGAGGRRGARRRWRASA